MTTQAEMRGMHASNASQKDMKAHVDRTGGYNGVANGFTGGGGGGGGSVAAGTPNAVVAAVNSATGGVTKGLKGVLGPLSKAGREAFSGSMYESLLDNTLGIFGGHEGKTNWENKAPPPTSPSYADYAKENPRGVLDGFTYQRTAAERAPGDARDAADRAKMYANGGGGEIYNGMRYSTDDNKIPDNQNRDSSGVSFDNNGNGVYNAPLSSVSYNNGFKSQLTSGGNNATISNYFSAMPNTMFTPVGNATGSTSPALRGVPISYSGTTAATAGE